MSVLGLSSIIGDRKSYRTYITLGTKVQLQDIKSILGCDRQKRCELTVAYM